MRAFLLALMCFCAGLLAAVVLTSSHLGLRWPAQAPSALAPFAKPADSVADDAPALGWTGLPPATAGEPATDVGSRETFQDWALACRKPTVNGAAPCAVTQQLLGEKSRLPVFAWAVTRDVNGKFGAVWELPTGLLLTRGLTLQLDQRDPIVVPIRTCDEKRCRAVANLEEGFLDLLGHAGAVSVTVYSDAGRPFRFNLGLRGLPEALQALRK